MVANARYTDEQREQFVMLRAAGMSNEKACQKFGINRKTGDAWWARYKKRQVLLNASSGPAPKTVGKIRQNYHSRRAYDDFAYFRLRCFGYQTSPWQLHAVETLRKAVEEEGKSFVCMNVFPGAGKTTLMQHFVCWLIVRNRTIRIIWGSASEPLAVRRVQEIRTELTRLEPGEGYQEDIAQGRAVKPENCLADLFGRFRPSGRHGTSWTQRKFTVCTPGSRGAEEGPPPSGDTLLAVGRDTDQLGLRANFIVWDDIWTQDEERSPELGKATKKFYDYTAESRLQPNGTMVLVMQRLGPNDLSAHVLRRMKPVLAEDGSEDGMEPEYRHIVYPAHHDDLCDGKHPRGRPAWDPHNPQHGHCLTDPKALPPEDYVRFKGRDNWLVWYQQKDVDPVNALIPEVWLTGGQDENGAYRGCLDFERGLFEVPEGIVRAGLVSAMAVDVGHENFWALYWSLFNPDDNNPKEWIIAAERRRMPAGTAAGLLDWDPDTQRFVGVMDEWVMLSKEIGIPITHIVAEINAAQRHLFRQTNLVDRWQVARNVRILSHTTNRNKADPKLGIEQLLPIRYRHGFVRLPWRVGAARQALQALYDEAKGYGQNHPTDDLLMAQWMLRLNRRKLSRPVAVVEDAAADPDIPAFVRRRA